MGATRIRLLGAVGLSAALAGCISVTEPDGRRTPGFAYSDGYYEDCSEPSSDPPVGMRALLPQEQCRVRQLLLSTAGSASCPYTYTFGMAALTGGKVFVWDDGPYLPPNVTESTRALTSISLVFDPADPNNPFYQWDWTGIASWVLFAADAVTTLFHEFEGHAATPTAQQNSYLYPETTSAYHQSVYSLADACTQGIT